MKIIVGFSRAKSPWRVGSRIILDVEKRNYSHVYVRFAHEITGMQIVYQASLGMVNAYNFDLFKEHNVIVEEYLLETTGKAQDIDFLVFLQKNLGKPYSKFAILFISIKKLFKIEVKYNDNNEQFICSELAFKIINIVKPEIEFSNSDYITPSDLNKLINEIRLPIYCEQ